MQGEDCALSSIRDSRTILWKSVHSTVLQMLTLQGADSTREVFLHPPYDVIAAQTHPLFPELTKERKYVLGEVLLSLNECLDYCRA